MSYRFLNSTVLGSPLKNEFYNIIGAGISGLFMGYFLKKKNIPFRIYEKSDRAGGLIRTDRNKFGISESAANGFLWCEEIKMMADEVGAEIIPPSKISNAKYLVRNKQLRKFPLNFLETLQMISKVAVPHFVSPETVKEFGDIYFGKKFSEQILNPAMGGIYAADIERMSFPGGLSKMAQLVEKSKWLPLAFAKYQLTKNNGIHSFRGGMQTFIDKLSEFLKDAIVYNTDGLQLKNNNENIILTAPANTSAVFFDSAEISNILEKVETPPVISVTYYFNKKAFRNFKTGFGCLIPGNEGMKMLGVLFNSEIFPDRIFDNENISLTCIANDRFLFTKSEKEITEIFLNELVILLGLKDSPLEHRIYIHKKGIPLYTPELYENWFKLNELLTKNHPHIRLFGNYTGQISIRGLAEGAAKATFHF